MQKKFAYKVYDQFDNYIRDITGDVLTTPKFSQEINSAGSEMVIRLGRNLDDFGEDFDIAFNNIVKIYITDSEVTNEIFFQGRIVNYKPIYGREELEVTLFSLGYELDYLIYREAETEEQVQTEGTDEVIIGPDSKIAQSFIPDQTSITSLVLKAKAEIAETSINISIRPDSNGQPSVTILDNSDISKNITNTVANEIIFIFETPVVVETATTYWLVVEAS